MRTNKLVTRRRFLQVSVAAGLGTCLYTWRVEPHWVEVVERRLPILNLPEELRGSRLVQLSDLHIGPRVDDRYLIRTLQRVQQLSPEIVVYTGDFTSYEAEGLGHFTRMIPHLATGRHATIGILGNHDYGPGWSHPDIAENIVELVAAKGIQVLRNQVTDIRGLNIVGLDDLWGGRFALEKALSHVQPEQPSIVLSHNPDSADEPGWEPYSGWILSGHTHGGQCKPPFLPAPLLPVKNRRYQAGQYELSGARMLYINRGLGHLLRVRFNVRPEVTVFQLDRAIR